MQEYALYAIAGSVFMHVAWNLMARHVAAHCNFLWWGLLAHIVLFGPWALWSLVKWAQWDGILLACLLVTSLCNAVYFLALRRAYTHAPVSLVYPVARSSPILIAVWGSVIFSQHLSLQGWIGIIISVAGLMVMSRWNRDGESRIALSWALLAAFCTSIYSLSDKIAVSHLPVFGSKMGFVTIGYLSSFVLLSFRNYQDHGNWVPQCRPQLRLIIAGGLMVGTAYALVIHAMTWIHAAYVVAYTNAGIVIATLVSIFVLKEKEACKSRITAVSIIVLGLVIISLR